MKEQRRTRFTVIVVILCLLTMIGAVYVCSYQVRENLKIEMQNTLRDVAEQNKVAVQKEIDARFQLLYSIAGQIDSEDDVGTLLDSMNSVVENYHFRRLGFTYADGSVYTTDGYSQDMSQLDFFKKGMMGVASLTEGTEEMAEDEQQYVSRFAVPVYHKGETEIIGVLFGTYGGAWIEDVLNAQSFEGKGYSCIIKPNGDVIAHSKGSPISNVKNLFDCLEETSVDAALTAEEIRRAMETGASGAGRIVMNGEPDIYYTPLSLRDSELDRYMITMVPAEVLTSRMQPIMSNVEQMFIIIIILVVCGVSIFLLSNQMKRKQLLKLAYTDSLTHGDNFACFQEKIKRKKGIHGFIIAMDLSDFKIINNTCGVATGDEVLRCVWQVLHDNIMADELAARIYADRFIMFFTDEDREAIKKRLEQLIIDMELISEILNTPRVIPNFGIHETINQEPLENDYGKAVHAKHLLKGRRDRNYAFYDEIDYNQVLENRGIEDGFDKAIAEKQFEIWYQPKYDAMTGVIVGAEALVRWRREDGSLLPPFKFIPIFEKNGMISRLDEYVFRTVCVQQKQWEKEGKKILPVSVNISRVSLYYYDIVDKYKIISNENAVETKYLQLEITESATVDNAEISNLIEQFHTAGFELLLDDFGTGYSSLSSLNMMHFDTMKLDKSLIDYIGDENGEKLLHYIMRLGQNMGLRITAEGVETKEQVEFLRDLKCNDIQGYYFSRPLHVEEYEKLLA